MSALPASRPSDELAEVLAQGRTDVRAMVMSMSARAAAPGADARYITWHQLDHMPEQYRIEGLRHGARWVSTPRCVAARLAARDRFAATDHLVTYLFGAPLDSALQRFFELGRALRQGGRMPETLPSVELAAYEFTGARAAPHALVGADVLPWRPATGIYLLIARDADAAGRDDLRSVDGVAGVWTFSGTHRLAPEKFADTSGLSVSVCYLDDDPVATAARLGTAVADSVPAERVEFAGPFEALIPWRWDAVVPGADPAG